MNYKHNWLNLQNDTIAALATPSGIGGIGIVRISGSLAWVIALKIFRLNKSTLDFKDIPERTLLLGKIIDPRQEEKIDEVLCVFFRKPRSYTTENVVEIQGHGGPVIMHKILELTLNEGCRLAHPGEFTLRAFLGGRIKLCQAEAVAELINSRSQIEAKLALNILEGSLADQLKLINKIILNIVAMIEAALDFPEELEMVNYQTLTKDLKKLVIVPLQNIIKNYQRHKIFREGSKVVFYGRPNVGKSSLFNVMLGRTRSLVSSQPGTTRDYLEETIILDGIVITLIDTAGIDLLKIKNEINEIEQLSQKTTKLIAKSANLKLIILDGSQELTVEDKNILEETKGESRLIVVNKADLHKVWQSSDLKLVSEEIIRISAKSGFNLKKFYQLLIKMLNGNEVEPISGEIVVSARQAQKLSLALEALKRAIKIFDANLGIEIAVIELTEALAVLGEIDGRNVSEEIIETIFNNFCLGK